MLKVLGRATSINVRKVLWAADELGIAFEREDWGLHLRNTNVPEFLALNPNALVPVIIDEGFVLWESNAIIRYLGEREGRTLMPANLRDRALAEQWLGWQAADLNPTWSYAMQALLRKTPGFDDQGKIADSMEKWGAKMAILEGQLEKTGAFAAGAEFTLADIALGLSAHRWFSIPLKLPELPRTRRYYDALMERPAGAKYMGAEFF